MVETDGVVRVAAWRACLRQRKGSEMITGEFWELLDDEALHRIDGAAVRLLTDSGCRIAHEGLLEMLEAAGCRIERSAMRCYFPEKLVRDAIEHLGGRCGEGVRIPLGWSPQQRLRHGGSFPHLLDWPGGERRPATRQDVVDMARMAHVLDEFETVGKVLTCSEVDQRIEPLWATLQLAQITDKHIGGTEVLRADIIEPLVRMAEVTSGRAGDTSLVGECDYFVSPLIFEPTQAECFLAKRRFGMRNMPGSMAISGLSAPVTIAGTVAVAAAELMAGWVLGYVVNPEIEAAGIVCTGSLDMRTMAACFASPEALLQDVATVQICRRLYGITVIAAIDYVDCKRPGIEAAFQKMYPLIAAPLGTGRGLCSTGLLSAGMAYSPLQHMLDAEMSKAVERFWSGFEVTEETIAAELIEKIVRSDETNFLATEHTTSHFRSEQWYPRWFDRSLWQGEPFERESEHEMLKRIDQYCRDAVRRYERPDIDQAKTAELKRIFLAAERRILGANETPV